MDAAKIAGSRRTGIVFDKCMCLPALLYAIAYSGNGINKAEGSGRNSVHSDCMVRVEHVYFFKLAESILY
jgi:hypothetical protein